MLFRSAPGAPSRNKIAALAVAITLGALTLPHSSWNWLPWFAGAAAALAAGRWFGAGATFAAESTAALALGRAWAFAARPWLPSAAPGSLEIGGAALGILAAATLVMALGLLALNTERRRLKAVSESRAGDLFERRRRLAATTLLIVSVFGLAQNLAG